MKFFFRIFLSVAVLATVLSLTYAQKQQVSSLLPKPGDFSIINYDTKNNDSYVLPTGELVNNDAGAILALRGKVTKILYKAPSTGSTLEIYEFYKKQLTQKGFKIFYAAQGDKLGSWRYVFYQHNPMLYGNEEDQCFISARSTTTTSSVYVAIYITLGFYQYPITSVDIIETVREEDPEDISPLPLRQTSKTISPLPKPAMEQSLNIFETALKMKGRVIIKDIRFEEGSNEISPGTENSLREIADAIKHNPELRFEIFYYTGSTKTLNLAQQRAEAILLNLVSSHGTDRNQISAKGIAFIQAITGTETLENPYNNRIELLIRE